MLLSLTIKNYALIESLEINFSDQFSIITGETGAGKSILLGALGLVLGNRADLSVLKDNEQKCVIEAHFLLKNYNLQSFFIENDLDYEDQSIIRREILPSGKSRAFINDSPVNLNVLQELANFLIDIHSQHQTREILNEEYQLEIVDAIANNTEIIVNYTKELKQFNSINKKLKHLKLEKETLSKEQEYNSFLLNELLLANLKEDEQEILEEELEQLSNVEFISESLDKALQISSDEQVGISINLNEVKQSLQKIAGLSKNYSDISERINSIQIEFQDIINECSSLSDKVINNPARLEEVNTKLQSIYTLQKKHQVNSVEELIIIREDLDAKVIKVDDLDFQINKLEIEVAEAQNKVNEFANKISERRAKSTSDLSKQIETILSGLGMPDAQIQFNISPTESYFKSGKDTIETLFTSNKGMQLGMLKKVASGGEMSRIMLAIKAVMANYTKLPSIIFDEIDTGVSGEIAIKIGEIMKEMSKNMQVFAITHLPQIAAKGIQHYKVYKYTDNETTVSELKLLTLDERIKEIAEMLSGKSISDSALNHAKALLN
ncbi:DNA repair protein RecN [Flavobacterium sp.]|jgi:DNA repair protein RecN (Recombination protein N)|uniref:DNA repair protein RecN n=1 Tax=Flavobacterium sp. TaxID=239 RepID=UPI002A80806C|nr:DNA repair protein RecN [Flavobacterium sp.]